MDVFSLNLLNLPVKYTIQKKLPELPKVKVFAFYRNFETV